MRSRSTPANSSCLAAPTAAPPFCSAPASAPRADLTAFGRWMACPGLPALLKRECLDRLCLAVGSAAEVGHQQVRVHAGGVGGACHVHGAAGHGDRGWAGEAVRRSEDGPRGAAGGDEVNLVEPGLR